MTMRHLPDLADVRQTILRLTECARPAKGDFKFDRGEHFGKARGEQIGFCVDAAVAGVRIAKGIIGAADERAAIVCRPKV
jgi:hypothetical protein